MNEPLISIVVPVYKTQQYLLKCIDSVLNQTYKNLELILVDDGSPDDCPRLCDEIAQMDQRVCVLHKRNGGVSSAKNAGIDAATGDYIGFVDSDDWIEPSMFETLLGLALEHKAEMSMCGYVHNGGIKTEISFKKNGVLKQAEALQNVLLPNGFEGFMVNKLFASKLLNATEGQTKKLRLNESIYYCEDQLFVCQAIMRSKSVAFTGAQLYHYLIRPDSLTETFTRESLTFLSAKYEIITLLKPFNMKVAEASYSNSASYFLCKFYKALRKDRATVMLLQKEARRYIGECRSVRFPIKDRIRMIGAIFFPDIFCQFWSYAKLAKRALFKLT